MKLRKEVFHIIIDVLNDYNYCFLRNYEILPEYANDIDILIEKGETEIILKKLIGRFEKEEVIHLYDAQFSCLSIYLYDLKTYQIIHIDFFEEIKWKVFEYLSQSAILETRIKYKNFFVPHPFYEMYELLLTRLIYQGKIKEVYKNRILSLYQRINGEIPFNTQPNFNAEIASQSWDEIEKRITIIRTKLIFSNILKPIKLSKNIFLFLQRIIKRFINPPGLFIAFYGVDGSGKTTQIKLLCDNLRGIYSDKIRLFHFRPSLAYKKPKNIIVNNPHNQLKTNYLRSFLKLIYYILIYNWGYLTQVFPFIAKNGLVIFDRYYFDIIIDPIRYRSILPARCVNFFGKFIPKPRINICLIANVDIINSRKKEISTYEIEVQQNRIAEIFSDGISYILRSDIDTFKTSNEIKQIIINNVRKKN